jgi:uncharacterized membrane protein
MWGVMPFEAGVVMLTQFSRLLSIGGWNAFFRTLLMLATAVGLAIAELAIFRQAYCAILIIAITALGWSFRKAIMTLDGNYSYYSKRILFVYGLGLFVANRVGVEHDVQIAIIAFACMIMFNLNLWSITKSANLD